MDENLKRKNLAEFANFCKKNGINMPIHLTYCLFPKLQEESKSHHVTDYAEIWIGSTYLQQNVSEFIAGVMGIEPVYFTNKNGFKPYIPVGHMDYEKAKDACSDITRKLKRIADHNGINNMFSGTSVMYNRL